MEESQKKATREVANGAEAGRVCGAMHMPNSETCITDLDSTVSPSPHTQVPSQSQPPLQKDLSELSKTSNNRALCYDYYMIYQDSLRKACYQPKACGSRITASYHRRPLI